MGFKLRSGKTARFSPVSTMYGVCIMYCMYGVVMFPRSNSKITVTSVLTKHMLCRRERSSVGDGRVSVLITGHAVTLARSSMSTVHPQQSRGDRNAPSLWNSQTAARGHRSCCLLSPGNGEKCFCVAITSSIYCR